MARRGGVGKPRAKRPYARMPARRPATRKKGRTGSKRRSAARGTMQKHAAPIAVGTSMAHGKRGPGGIGYSMRQISDTCTRIIGRAYVGEVNTTGKTAYGSASAKNNALGLVFDINPSLLNDRVAVIASTFQKYVYQGVKFTYVPQIGTTAPGSIGLVFDRDPLEISANTQGTQFLSEVMSYEHAVLTPGYIEASTAYTRDPKELKTWYLGAPDATLTTRETSQGNLLVYMSNCAANTGYGFIVMDYVLDLIAPSLLPNKQNITAIRSAPSQWIDCSGQGATPINDAGALNSEVQGQTVYGYTSAPAWFASNFDSAAQRPGVVGELHLGGNATLPAAGGNPAAPGGLLANFYVQSGGAVYPDNGAAVAFKCGQKLYFAVHQYWSGGPGNTKATLFSWHTTLSSARAAVSEFKDNNTLTTQANVLPDQIFLLAQSQIFVGGWARLIAEGSSSEDNA